MENQEEVWIMNRTKNLLTRFVRLNETEILIEGETLMLIDKFLIREISIKQRSNDQTKNFTCTDE